MNFKNGRKFDTTQNNEDLAHLFDSDFEKPQDAGPIGITETADAARFQEAPGSRGPPDRRRRGWLVPEQRSAMSASHAAASAASSPDSGRAPPPPRLRGESSTRPVCT